MADVGYGRASSLSQSLDIQLDALKAAGCEKVFSEKRTGTTTDNRDALVSAIEWCREGDVLVVTRLDRLARSITDLRSIIDQLTAKGVGFRALQQTGIDTTRPEGRLMLNMLASFAEFETDLRKDRQAEGIAKAKAAGVYRGRPPKSDPATVAAQIAALETEGLGATEIAKRLCMGRASVYRLRQK